MPTNKEADEFDEVITMHILEARREERKKVIEEIINQITVIGQKRPMISWASICDMLRAERGKICLNTN